MAQTRLQQAGLLQNGVECAAQHAPAPLLQLVDAAPQAAQLATASLAQMLSQLLVQQNESIAQTIAQQPASEQYGVECAAQQGAVELPHWLFPVAPQAAQFAAASLTQNESQLLVQQ
ncbi:MAG: hypothetical protein U0625_04055 [Phycisphaerales bacterium]